MFKTTYYHEVGNRKNVKQPYQISLEGSPSFCTKFNKTIFYDLNYSNKVEVIKACETIDSFLEEIFFYADLIYFRLLSLCSYDFNIPYSKRSYINLNNDLQNLRSQIITGSLKNLKAYQSINVVANFINHLIGLCPYYRSNNSYYSEKCFEQLQKLLDNFIQSYRNAAITKDLKYLNFLTIEKL